MTTTIPAIPEPVPGSATGRDEHLVGWPTFIREFGETLAVHSQYVMHGNIRDRFVIPGRDTLITLPGLIWEALRVNGYDCVIVYDQVDGLRVLPEENGQSSGGDTSALSAAKEIMGEFGAGEIPLSRLFGYIAAVARTERRRAAFIIDYAARLPRSAGDPAPQERDFFVACMKLSCTARRRPGPNHRPGPLYNPVVWLVEGERDLPPWLIAGNVHIRTVGVPAPDLGHRHDAAMLLARTMAKGTLDPDAHAAVGRFATESDGLPLQAMLEVSRLARDRGMPVTALPDALRVYKLGVVDNPWRRGFLRARIRRHEHDLIRGRVIGQPQAVTKTMDILKRAALGLSGAQAKSSASRPRGVLFFAGPTGVGKTELAKAVAHLVFGDESAYVRFDMSEFSAEHSADRLIGAPPGYVGFEAGGELTNAVRQQPFRVVLFDEIEKANEKILDKFLQILEDGRLTDGQGVTTYFSECVIIFTSNLGVLGPEDPVTKERKVLVDPERTKYTELEQIVKSGVTVHFTQKIGRPELLNRLGDNIVVFNFISPEAARTIFDNQLGNVIDTVATELQVRLILPDKIRDGLRTRCTGNLRHGGRGIGNDLESRFINPLARALFDLDISPGDTVTVTSVDVDGSTPSVQLRG